MGKSLAVYRHDVRQELKLAYITDELSSRWDADAFFGPDIRDMRIWNPMDTAGSFDFDD